MIETDVLVIGSGIAGLSFAIKMAEKFPEKEILVLTKSDEDESNTKYAQGGIAVVIDRITDSFEKHIEDTLRAGDGLCNKEIVEMVVKEAPDRLQELISWGANFDKTEDNRLHLGREGGHSSKRIVHHKDMTGFEMERTLINQVKKHNNIRIYNHFFVLELITQHHLKNEKGLPGHTTVFGVYALDCRNGSVVTIQSQYTLLASGGCGQVYATTTNPTIATGDGLAMAYRAGASIKNMEFIQFHPTALYNPGESPAFLISEAVRGAGAYLLNGKGERFMFNYDKRGELASRDIVAQAIDQEMKKHGVEHVYLDCRHIPSDQFKREFPNILKKCKSLGIDPAKDLIPVIPAAHYMCGGVVVDKNARTSIERLYASGECAYTGLHGANRLASNSLLEALVFSHQAYLDVSQRFKKEKPYKLKIPAWNSEGTTHPKEHVLISFSRKELQLLMNNYVGIVRSNVRLKRAASRVKLLKRETEELYKKTILSPQLCELRNLINVAELIIKSSIKRKTNKGCFYKINE